MDWDKFFKKYLWDEEKTPYLTAVERLTRRQADYEVHFYAILLGVLFAVVAVAASTSRLPQGPSPGVAWYAFSVVCAAVIFAFSKHYWAALYCAATPIAALAYVYLYGFHPKLGQFDHVVIVVVVLLWLRYSWRVVAIGRHYPDLADAHRNGAG